MKKLIILIGTIIYLSLSACVEVDIVDRYTENEYYQKEEQFDLHINGVYSAFYRTNYHKTNWLWALSGYEDFFVITGNGDAKEDISKNMHTSNTGMVTGFWVSIYDAIENANKILATIDDVPFKDEVEKERIKAECYFLRGLFHYDLVRLYGGGYGIPIKTDITSGIEDAFLKQSPVTEVYEQIFKDFEYATGSFVNKDGVELTRLPIRGEARYVRERASWGAAHAFLAEAYLTQRNWDKAIAHADTVINMGNYKLVEDFSKLWGVENEAIAEQEYIFATSFISDTDAKDGSSLGSGAAYILGPKCGQISGESWSGHKSGDGDGDAKFQKWVIDYYNSDWQGFGYSGPESVFALNTTNVTTAEDMINNPHLAVKDYRIESSLIRMGTVRNEQFATTNYIVYYPLIETNPVKGFTYYDEFGGAKRYSKNENFSFVQKYKDARGVGPQTNGNDFPRMRLADMYLVRAEAYNEKGEVDNAIENLNVIRARARQANGIQREFPKNIDDPSLDINKGTINMRFLIFMERGLEFIGEGRRWFDMVRMDYNATTPMYDYVMDNFLPNFVVGEMGGKVSAECVLNKRKKYFPIPFAEIQKNQNVKQNPGY